MLLSAPFVFGFLVLQETVSILQVVFTDNNYLKLGLLHYLIYIFQLMEIHCGKTLIC